MKRLIPIAILALVPGCQILGEPDRSIYEGAPVTVEGEVSIAAAAAVEGGSLRVSLRFTNVGSSPAEVNFDNHCSFGPYVIRAGAPLVDLGCEPDGTGAYQPWQTLTIWLVPGESFEHVVKVVPRGEAAGFHPPGFVRIGVRYLRSGDSGLRRVTTEPFVL